MNKMEYLASGKSCLLLILLTIQFYLTHSLLSLSIDRTPRCTPPTNSSSKNSLPLSSGSSSLRKSSFTLQRSKPSVEEEHDSITLDTYAKTTTNHGVLDHRHLTSYTLYWDNLLQREYQETLIESQRRRKLYTRSQLEASGLVIFNAVATPELELYGEKIVRVTIIDPALRNKRSSAIIQQNISQTSKRNSLRDKFKRGDVLLLTPQISFRGKDDIPPREGLVMDVGNDYLTLGVGSTWPLGLIEMRKNVDSYRVRLDKSLSGVPLRAQRMALEKLRKGQAGNVAALLVQLYYEQHSSLVLDTAREVPCHFDHCPIGNDLEQQIKCSMKEAVQAYRATYSFWPNTSQREAIIWALKRRMALIRGPPGTGKTRTAALLIATALRLKLKPEQELEVGCDMAAEVVQNDGSKTATPRILAVTHSNGAADVLLEALLQMNVPAVRAGRPASVSPSVQHRTIAALSERMPEVISLRQQAKNVTLDDRSRNAAAYEAQRYANDIQTMISKTAPVVVASCIGAQQLLSCLGDEDDASPAFQIVVLDESAQTTEPALVCALAAAKARQVILVGDPMQLPPTVTTQDAELRKTIGVSPMERLLKNGVEEFVLNEQYRMPYSLLFHPNKYFYNSVVKCASTSMLPPPKGFPWPSPNSEPLAFLEIGNGGHEVAHSFGGRSNPTEVEVIFDIVQKVIAAGDVTSKDISIITPYNKQAQLFRKRLNNASNINSQKHSNVQVGTVDSFQGQETELVIFSAVRSNQLKELGFLRDARRLNVAITRARRGLIIVGDPTVLRTCRHWAALMESCSDRSCVLTETEYNNHRIEGKVNGEKSFAITEDVEKDDEFYGLFTT